MTFRELLAEELKDPEFKKLWDESEEEYQQELARLKAEIEAEEKAGIVRHPTYEEAIAWMKDYEIKNA
jgi:hypothetical protein